MGCRLAVCLGVLVWSGCIQDSLVRCADGRACPVGMVCDDVHASCATAAQITACSSAAEGSDCIAGPITGACFDGVCIPRGCGNRVVESDEQCDDGNQISHDGCRGDCLSDETCGNGVVDQGEQCDDHNLMSRDECDSACKMEQATWEVLPVVPLRNVALRMGAFDAARGRMVRLTAYATWEWDGSDWKGFVTPAAPVAFALYYDADRGRVQAIDSDGTALRVSEWDGATWTPRSSTNAPPFIAPRAMVATFDVPRHRAVVIATPSQGNTMGGWAIDAAGTWSNLSSTPAVAAQDLYTMAYDGETGDLILLVSSSTVFSLAQWAYNGTTWATTTAPPQRSDTSLVFHAGVGHMWMIGGMAAAQTDPLARNVYQKAANHTWTEITAAVLPIGAASFDLGYDATRATVIACGGSTYANSRAHGEVFEFTGGAWTAHSKPIISPREQAIAGGGGRLVAFGGFDEPGVGSRTFVWTDHTWQPLTTSGAPPARRGAAAVFDPIRGGVVLYGGENSSGTEFHDTWLLAGSTWTMIDDGSSTGFFDVPPGGIAFDPIRRRSLMLIAGQTWSLSSTASTWTRETDLPTTTEQATSIAWSARDQLITATTTSSTYDLVGDSWVKRLTPGSIEKGIADERAGTVNLLPLYGTDTQTWQRRGTNWSLSEPLPIAIRGSGGYDARTGETVVVGTPSPSLTPTSLFVLVRSVTSATPLEACNAGEDDDLDGLVGCADPDCWWQCAPACPPLTSCP